MESRHEHVRNFREPPGSKWQQTADDAFHERSPSDKEAVY